MKVVCYTAVPCVVTQRSSPQEALRDDTKNAVKRLARWESDMLIQTVIVKVAEHCFAGGQWLLA